MKSCNYTHSLVTPDDLHSPKYSFHPCTICNYYVLVHHCYCFHNITTTIAKLLLLLPLLELLSLQTFLKITSVFDDSHYTSKRLVEIKSLKNLANTTRATIQTPQLFLERITRSHCKRLSTHTESLMNQDYLKLDLHVARVRTVWMGPFQYYLRP